MGSHLRILTANLYNGAADPDAFAELVQAQSADVVAVQELGYAEAEALSAVLPYGRLEPADDFTGMGIALRHEPGDLWRVPLAYRDARVVRLEPGRWPGLERVVELVNVHFAAPTARPIWAQRGIRYAQVTGLLRYLDASPHFARAVVGDFNATPIWPVYRRMASRLTDVAALHARHSGRRAAATWPTWLGRLRPLRIDHCFAEGFEVLGARVLDVPGSDHCALRVDLSAK